MIGEPVNKICPLCGGPLYSDIATIPYILDNDVVIVIKGVPAEICGNCHEPFTSGKVTDEVMTLLNQLKALQSEVSVISYSAYAPA